MKKLFPILLCILLLCSCSPATYDGPTRPEWVIAEITKEHLTPYSNPVANSRTIYSYDIYGNLSQTLQYRGDEETLKTVYTYDARGNKLTQTQYDLRGWFPKRAQQSVYTYDEQDRITSATHPDAKYTYLFDDEANTCTTLEDGKIIQVDAYDGNGNELSCYSVDGDYWHLFEYTYDAQGRRITEHITDSDGFDRLKRYAYDTHGNTILVDTLTNGERTVTRSEFEYDDQGRPVRQFRLTDTSRMLVCRWEYLDEHGSYTHYDSDGTPNHTVIYDEMGHQISLVHYIEGTDQVGFRETTTYKQIQVPDREEDAS